MNQRMTEKVLQEETSARAASGGTSAANRSYGFHPAFRDTQTGRIYLSSYASGRIAPCHLIDGLPNEVVAARDAEGRVAAVKASVIAGFLLEGRFYTREEAAGQARRELQCARSRDASWMTSP